MKEKRLVFKGVGPEGPAGDGGNRALDAAARFANALISGKQEKLIKEGGKKLRAEREEQARMQKKADSDAANELMTELGLDPSEDEDIDTILSHLDADKKGKKQQEQLAENDAK